MNIYTSQFRRVVACIVVGVFLVTSLQPPAAYAQSVQFSLPAITTPVSVHNPLMMKGLKIFANEPMRFDFVISGDDESEYQRLIKYFLASLTIPEEDLWVNLSPEEPDRIIPKTFSQTEMGRDMLAQDYLLKQITASLLHPDNEYGKQFWNRIYEHAGTSDIPVETLNKVWIVPEKAEIYEGQDTAYIVDAKFKVMTEESYMREFNSVGVSQGPTPSATSRILHETIIPELTRAVNEDLQFANLRQIFNSLILATWYKRKLKTSLVNQIYADQHKTAGLETPDGDDVNQIYNNYVNAFKDGVFELIKDDYDPVEQDVTSRKYISGGVVAGNFAMNVVKHIPLMQQGQGESIVAVQLKTEEANPAMSQPAEDAAMTQVELEKILDQAGILTEEDFITSGGQAVVITKSNWDFVIKVADPFFSNVEANPRVFHESHQLAKEKLGGLVGNYTVLPVLKLNINGEIKEFKNVVIQEKVQPLEEAFHQAVASKESERVIWLVKEKARVDKEILRRGLYFSDPGIEHYGLTKDGRLVMVDVGGFFTDLEKDHLGVLPSDESPESIKTTYFLQRGYSHYTFTFALARADQEIKGLGQGLTQLYSEQIGIDLIWDERLQHFNLLKAVEEKPQVFQGTIPLLEHMLSISIGRSVPDLVRYITEDKPKALTVLTHARQNYWFSNFGGHFYSLAQREYELYFDKGVDRQRVPDVISAAMTAQHEESDAAMKLDRKEKVVQSFPDGRRVIRQELERDGGGQSAQSAYIEIHELSDDEISAIPDQDHIREKVVKEYNDTASFFRFQDPLFFRAEKADDRGVFLRINGLRSGYKNPVIRLEHNKPVRIVLPKGFKNAMDSRVSSLQIHYLVYDKNEQKIRFIVTHRDYPTDDEFIKDYNLGYTASGGNNTWALAAIEEELGTAVSAFKTIQFIRAWMDNHDMEDQPLVIWQNMSLGELYPYFTDDILYHLGAAQWTITPGDAEHDESTYPSTITGNVISRGQRIVLVKHRVSSADFENKKLATQEEVVRRVNRLLAFSRRNNAVLVMLDHSFRGNDFSKAQDRVMEHHKESDINIIPITQYSYLEDFVLEQAGFNFVVINTAIDAKSYFDDSVFLNSTLSDGRHLPHEIYVRINGTPRSVSRLVRQYYGRELEKRLVKETSLPDSFADRAMSSSHHPEDPFWDHPEVVNALANLALSETVGVDLVSAIKESVEAYVGKSVDIRKVESIRGIPESISAPDLPSIYHWEIVDKEGGELIFQVPSNKPFGFIKHFNEDGELDLIIHYKQEEDSVSVAYFYYIYKKGALDYYFLKGQETFKQDVVYTHVQAISEDNFITHFIDPDRRPYYLENGLSKEEKEELKLLNDALIILRVMRPWFMQHIDFPVVCGHCRLFNVTFLGQLGLKGFGDYRERIQKPSRGPRHDYVSFQIAGVDLIIDMTADQWEERELDQVKFTSEIRDVGVVVIPRWKVKKDPERYYFYGEKTIFEQIADDLDPGESEEEPETGVIVKYGGELIFPQQDMKVERLVRAFISEEAARIRAVIGNEERAAPLIDLRERIENEIIPRLIAFRNMQNSANSAMTTRRPSGSAWQATGHEAQKPDVAMANEESGSEADLIFSGDFSLSEITSILPRPKLAKPFEAEDALETFLLSLFSAGGLFDFILQEYRAGRFSNDEDMIARLIEALHYTREGAVAFGDLEPYLEVIFLLALEVESGELSDLDAELKAILNKIARLFRDEFWPETYDPGRKLPDRFVRLATGLSVMEDTLSGTPLLLDDLENIYYGSPGAVTPLHQYLIYRYHISRVIYLHIFHNLAEFTNRIGYEESKKEKGFFEWVLEEYQSSDDEFVIDMRNLSRLIAALPNVFPEEINEFQGLQDVMGFPELAHVVHFYEGNFLYEIGRQVLSLVEQRLNELDGGSGTQELQHIQSRMTTGLQIFSEIDGILQANTFPESLRILSEKSELLARIGLDVSEREWKKLEGYKVRDEVNDETLHGVLTSMPQLVMEERTSEAMTAGREAQKPDAAMAEPLFQFSPGLAQEWIERVVAQELDREEIADRLRMAALLDRGIEQTWPNNVHAVIATWPEDESELEMPGHAPPNKKSNYPLHEGPVFEQLSRLSENSNGLNFRRLDSGQGWKLLRAIQFNLLQRHIFPQTYHEMSIKTDDEGQPQYPYIYVHEIPDLLKGHHFTQVMATNRLGDSGVILTELYFVNGVFIGYGISLAYEKQNVIGLQFHIFEDAGHPDYGRGKVKGLSTAVFKARINVLQEIFSQDIWENGKERGLLVLPNQYATHLDNPEFYLQPELGFEANRNERSFFTDAILPEHAETKYGRGLYRKLHDYDMTATSPATEQREVQEDSVQRAEDVDAFVQKLQDDYGWSVEQTNHLLERIGDIDNLAYNKTIAPLESIIRSSGEIFPLPRRFVRKIFDPEVLSKFFDKIGSIEEAIQLLLGFALAARSVTRELNYEQRSFESVRAGVLEKIAESKEILYGRKLSIVFNHFFSRDAMSETKGIVEISLQIKATRIARNIMGHIRSRLAELSQEHKINHLFSAVLTPDDLGKIKEFSPKSIKGIRTSGKGIVQNPFYDGAYPHVWGQSHDVYIVDDPTIFKHPFLVLVDTTEIPSSDAAMISRKKAAVIKRKRARRAHQFSMNLRRERAQVQSAQRIMPYNRVLDKREEKGYATEYHNAADFAIGQGQQSIFVVYKDEREVGRFTVTHESLDPVRYKVYYDRKKFPMEGVFNETQSRKFEVFSVKDGERMIRVQIKVRASRTKKGVVHIFNMDTKDNIVVEQWKSAAMTSSEGDIDDENGALALLGELLAPTIKDLGKEGELELYMEEPPSAAEERVSSFSDVKAVLQSLAQKLKGRHLEYAKTDLDKLLIIIQVIIVLNSMEKRKGYEWVADRIIKRIQDYIAIKGGPILNKNEFFKVISRDWVVRATLNREERLAAIERHIASAESELASAEAHDVGIPYRQRLRQRIRRLEAQRRAILREITKAEIESLDAAMSARRGRKAKRKHPERRRPYEIMLEHWRSQLDSEESDEEYASADHSEEKSSLVIVSSHDELLIIIGNLNRQLDGISEGKEFSIFLTEMESGLRNKFITVREGITMLKQYASAKPVRILPAEIKESIRAKITGLYAAMGGLSIAAFRMFVEGSKHGMFFDYFGNRLFTLSPRWQRFTESEVYKEHQDKFDQFYRAIDHEVVTPYYEFLGAYTKNYQGAVDFGLDPEITDHFFVFHRRAWVILTQAKLQWEQLKADIPGLSDEETFIELQTVMERVFREVIPTLENLTQPPSEGEMQEFINSHADKIARSVIRASSAGHQKNGFVFLRKVQPDHQQVVSSILLGDQGVKNIVIYDETINDYLIVLNEYGIPTDEILKRVWERFYAKNPKHFNNFMYKMAHFILDQLEGIEQKKRSESGHWPLAVLIADFLRTAQERIAADRLEVLQAAQDDGGDDSFAVSNAKIRLKNLKENEEEVDALLKHAQNLGLPDAAMHAGKAQQVTDALQEANAGRLYITIDVGDGNPKRGYVTEINGRESFQLSTMSEPLHQVDVIVITNARNGRVLYLQKGTVFTREAEGKGESAAMGASVDAAMNATWPEDAFESYAIILEWMRRVRARGWGDRIRSSKMAKMRDGQQEKEEEEEEMLEMFHKVSGFKLERLNSIHIRVDTLRKMREINRRLTAWGGLLSLALIDDSPLDENDEQLLVGLFRLRLKGFIADMDDKNIDISSEVMKERDDTRTPGEMRQALETFRLFPELDVNTGREFYETVEAGFSRLIVEYDWDRLIDEIRYEDDAMTVEETPGGIDFTPNTWDLDVKGEGVELQFSPEQIEDMRQNIIGLTPVILNVQPMTNLPLFLGLTDSPQDNREDQQLAHGLDLVAIKD